MNPFTFTPARSAFWVFGLLATLHSVAVGCYGNPRIGGCTDCKFDGGSHDDGSDQTDRPTCDSSSKLCDGKCIPAVTCCGPCSCEGLANTCGPNADENCCSTVLVKGGTFNRDNDRTYPATVGDFHLDRFEITVGRFNRFVAAGQGLQVAAPQSGSGRNDLDVNDTGWDPSWNIYLASTAQALATNVQCTKSTYLSGDAVLPMNCITWYEAYAFCIWDGGRLPTEAEWTYAAAGGGAADGQRVYPWSVPPSSTTGDGTYAVSYTTAPGKVGSRSPEGDGKWSQSDLVGNVAEWLADYAGAYPIPCYNCANRAVSERRVLRGGDWALPALDNTASKTDVTPITREAVYGARCARR